MNFEANTQNQPENGIESIRSEVTYPHLEAVYKLLDTKLENESEEPIVREAVADIMWRFLEDWLNSAKIYSSEKFDTSFPYTSIDVKEVAIKLYEQYTGKKVDIDSLEKNTKKKHIEFIFTSVPIVQSINAGSIFGFMEEAMQQVIKELPKALEDLQANQEPDSSDIYNLGAPINEYGKMSDKFLAKLQSGAFTASGELYAEFIQSTMADKNHSDTNILLYGQSMGASLAAETGKCLLENEVVTQSNEDHSSTPSMKVRMDMPVGSSGLPSEKKSWQIPLGFIADAGFTLITDPYFKTVMGKDKEFLGTTKSKLLEKGFISETDDQQMELKTRAAKVFLSDLRKGTPVPEGLKVIKVIGGSDLLMWDSDLREQMSLQMDQHQGTLAQNALRVKEEGHRAFGIKSMRHTMPYFRKNGLKRLVRSAKSLASLKVKE